MLLAILHAASDARADEQAPAEPPAAPPTLTQRCEQRAQELSAADRSRYVICVDAFAVHQDVVTLECGETNAPSCKEVGDVLRTNRNFHVSVWHPTGTLAVIDLGGTRGDSSVVHDPQRGVESVQLRRTDRLLGSRKVGDVKLGVVIRTPHVEPEKDTNALTLEHSFTLENYYRVAVRLGLGLTWAPWARRVDVRTTQSGQRYSAVVDGEDHGLVVTELVTGASYLLCEMSETDLKLCGAFGIRLGVLAFDSTEVKPLSSLMIGFEGALGIDFALGIYVGAARQDTPQLGYEPNHLLAHTEESIKTNFGVTPAFGVVLNFTPGVLKGIGIAP